MSGELSEKNCDGAREFVFTTQNFERIRKLIYDHAGIALSPNKKDMVYSRLARRLRVTGHSNFDDYVDLIEQGDAAEWEPFVNALTTNLTAFFREPHHFVLLKDYLRARPPREHITIWCSAASTGEEPYSIAMTVAEVFGYIPPTVKILASDLDTRVLEQARLGVYSQDRVEKLSAPQLKKYFLRGSGKHAGMVRVRPELRAMLTFRQINLLDATWPMRGPFDVIFCRNVMIYFDRPTQYAILEKFVPLMAPDGLLFAGHSESFHHANKLFRLREKTVYALAPGASEVAQSPRARRC